jgi:citrate lyase beta subunit
MCQRVGTVVVGAISVVHAAASAGLDGADVAYLDLEDLEGMVMAAEQARQRALSGKGAIHPKQIAALNEVFTPFDEEVARARVMVTMFEEADTGLVVIDAKLIERPVRRDLYRTLAIANRIG